MKPGGEGDSVSSGKGGARGLPDLTQNAQCDDHVTRKQSGEPEGGAQAAHEDGSVWKCHGRRLGRVEQTGSQKHKA